jgi:hypothetical protein
MPNSIGKELQPSQLAHNMNTFDAMYKAAQDLLDAERSGDPKTIQKFDFGVVPMASHPDAFLINGSVHTMFQAVHGCEDERVEGIVYSYHPHPSTFTLLTDIQPMQCGIFFLYSLILHPHDRKTCSQLSSSHLLWPSSRCL